MPRQAIFDKFKAGTLKSSSGSKVTSREQAIAIALSYPKTGERKGLARKKAKPK